MGIQDILPGREGRAVGKVVSFALFWLCPLDHCGRLEEMNLKMTRTNYNNCDSTRYYDSKLWISRVVMF